MCMCHIVSLEACYTENQSRSPFFAQEDTLTYISIKRLMLIGVFCVPKSFMIFDK